MIEAGGRLDVLVNNAGVMRQAGVEEMSTADWAHDMAVNLTAPFLMIRAALPHLRAARGSIVNIGSIEGLGSNPGHASYCASKAGLHGLTRAVAIDHGGDGVRCNAVAPGWIDTELNEDFIESMEDPAAFRRQIGGIPSGRPHRQSRPRWRRWSRSLRRRRRRSSPARSTASMAAGWRRLSLP